MTLRDSSDRNPSRKVKRTFMDRLRGKLRRKERRLLTESLEQRQLLAGPNLVAIQSDETQILTDNAVLDSSPRELVFRFDDREAIDPASIAGGIQIIASGNIQDGFASATSDLGTEGAALVEFRALERGFSGDGLRVLLSSQDQGVGGARVTTSVDSEARTVSLLLNSNPANEATIRDVVLAIRDDEQAGALIEATQVSGSSLTELGDAVSDGVEVTLVSASASQVVTDFGTNGQVSVKFASTTRGASETTTSVVFSRLPLNLPAGQLPYVSTTGNQISVILDSTPGKESTVQDAIDAINANGQSASLVRADVQSGNSQVVISDLSFSPLLLLPSSSKVVQPGYVGLGDSPHEVVFRFRETLPQDEYTVQILGTGVDALVNAEGEPFADGENFSLDFSVNSVPQVAAVLPTPVRRQNDGTLTLESDVVEIHFTEQMDNPTDPDFYELIYTKDTADTLDDVSFHPEEVTYDASRKVASLKFARSLSDMRDPADPDVILEGTVRLRVGESRSAPGEPSMVDVGVGNEPGDTFSNSYTLDSNLLNSGPGATESLVVSGEIVNREDEYDLDFPGGADMPGIRNIRPEDPSRLDLAVPLDVWREDADAVSGISTVYYEFPQTWLGDDPNEGRPGEPDLQKTYVNVITEQQKERVREALSIFSQYLGVQFIETNRVPAETVGDDSNAYIAIGVGELYGAGFTVFENSEVGGVTVASRPLDEEGNPFTPDDPDADLKRESGNNLLVMDFQDFSASTDDQLGGKFFRGAMLGVGQLLGYGYADHLSQPVTQSTASVLSPTLDNEALFPSPADIVNGQYLYRPESNDIDLYQFNLENSGTVNIQSVAERLRSASGLNTSLRLYQDQGGDWIEIAANDDYFSKDSLIELSLSPGDYMVGISASGNTTYDPAISGTGIGGLSEGAYELKITFRADGAETLNDLTNVALDGDMDDEAGGDFNYWFIPSNQADTIFVDSRSEGVGNGSLDTPYTSIGDAIDQAEVTAASQIRVVGGSYSIGLDNLGVPLDEVSLDLPQGVQLVVDAGTTFRMRRSQVSVGSSSENTDRSQTSIQLLGLPENPVIFTSAAISPAAGDWGGINIRNDIDAADGSRVDFEKNGVFLNHMQFADLRYGGGAVSVDGVQSIVSSVELNNVRPTIINSTITNSADAAIAATPDSFEETRFDEYRFQRDGHFTSDYQRIGPHIRGNTIVDNTVNGLLFRIETPSGSELETLSRNARLDDTDIVHVLTENLIIEGSVGGLDASLLAPSVVLVIGEDVEVTDGQIVSGQYVYKITFVTELGYETSPSSETTLVSVEGQSNAIQLTNLPALTPALSDRGYIGRRLYRASVDDQNTRGEFKLVADLNSTDLSYTDTVHTDTLASNATIGPDDVVIARPSAGLTIDPGTVVKLQGARVELTFGARLYAEGTAQEPITFTSTRDSRFGDGGTFQTMALGDNSLESLRGDWGGLIAGFGATLSLDHAEIIGAGGATRIEGGFGSFNPVEAHQADLRIANSRFEDNADGRGFINDPRDPTFERVGRSDNASGTVFVRGSQPVITENQFIDGNGPAMTFDLNSFTWQEVIDQGRSTGLLDAANVFGNSGPLISGNQIGASRENTLDPSVPAGDPVNRNYAPFDAKEQNNPIDDNGDLVIASLLGLEVRGGEVTAGLVLDDVDIVHIVRDTIEIPNQHIYGGLRLESDARGSLVVKFQSQDEDVVDTLARRHAGIVVGGNLITAEEQFVDIADRVGGSLQVVGHPDFPVVLTSLADDSVGSGFTHLDGVNIDTDNNGLFVDSANPELLIPDELKLTATGTWDGITIREAASDANVLITNENEPQNLGSLLVNDPNRFRSNNEIPSNSQYLGELADSTSGGDNVRRLGFIVEGTIAQPGDLDVYSFVAEAGTQVWLDVDRTNSRLDTVIELIDANGNVRALSNDSLAESDPSNPQERIVETLQEENVRDLQITKPVDGSSSDYQDAYSTNPRDAGMRLVLPGTLGQRNLYHVRVRSSNTDTHDAESLTDPSNVRRGLTAGAYQLQIRLTEGDVFAGTQLRFGDQRFAVNGVEIVGGPIQSPITGDDFEINADNNSINNAQRLGLYETLVDAQADWAYDRNAANAGGPNLQNVILDNPAGPLSSDKLAKSVSGFLDDETDVDWYEFEIQYPKLTKDATVRYLSTVFDLDYTDGLARPNTSMFVFDSTGSLVLMGTDSNVADDQVIVDEINNDLLRGSFGTNDPFIGVSELNEGTYFVAVSNQTQVPADLGQFFQADPANPLLRLEPVDSVRRLVEDRLDRTYGGTADAPLVPVLFDTDSVVDYSLDDAVVYLSTATGLFVGNAKTGSNYLGNAAVGVSGPVIQDVAFTSEGSLRGFNNFDYFEIDTSNGSKSALGDMDMSFLTGPRNNNGDWARSSDGFNVTALTIRNIASGQPEEGFVVGRRTGTDSGGGGTPGYVDNILFEFNPQDGIVAGTDSTGDLSGSGASKPEIGRIDTTDRSIVFPQLNTVLGLTDATAVGVDGIKRASIGDGDQFTVRSLIDQSQSITFEFDQGYTLEAPEDFLLSQDDSVVIQGKTFQFTTDRYVDFGTITALLAADPDQTPAGLLNQATVSIVDTNGQTFDFTFVQELSEEPVNTEIALVGADGSDLPLDQILDALADAISSEVLDVVAVRVSDRIAFVSQPASITITGTTQVRVEGGTGVSDPTIREVALSAGNLSDGEAAIAALAEAVRDELRIVVINVGTQMAMPDLRDTPSFGLGVQESDPFRVTGVPGLIDEFNHERIALYPNDTAESIAIRIERTLAEVSLSGSAAFANLRGARITTLGQSLEMSGVFVDSIESPNTDANLVDEENLRSRPSGLSFGGSPNGGAVTGVELLIDAVDGGRDLYGISANGGLYRVDSSTLNADPSGNNPSIAAYVKGSQSLQGLLESIGPGVSFTGLRAGPMFVEDGAYRQVLFGTTSNGQMHAFTNEGDLLNVFANGRASVDTGVVGVSGIDFSTLDYNLWHVTENRGNNPGHGISSTFNGSRGTEAGGSSLAFSYLRSDFIDQYQDASLTGEAPNANATYNFPAGAKGAVASNAFSLAGYSPEDQPVLYFNYFSETESLDGLDALRVYVATEDGVEHLVATNNRATGSEVNDDEFDDPDTASFPAYEDEIDAEVQPIFDGTDMANATWRQVRVPLESFAGQTNLTLRIEFSTSGTTRTTTDSMRIISGSALAEKSNLIFAAENSEGNSEGFALRLADVAVMPSGEQLVDWLATGEEATIQINQTEYRFDSSGISVFDTVDSVTTARASGVITYPKDLVEMTSSEVASFVSSTIETNAPLILSGANLESSDQYGGVTRGTVGLTWSDEALQKLDDYSWRATRIPESRFSKNYELTGSFDHRNDVDLVRVELKDGDQVVVNLAASDPANPIPDAQVSFYTETGEEVPAQLVQRVTDGVSITATFTTAESGTFYAALARGFDDGFEYHPLRVPGSSQGPSNFTYLPESASPSYVADITVQKPSSFETFGSTVEFFGGHETLATTPQSGLFAIETNPQLPDSTNIDISRGWSAEEVASVVQDALASRFSQGDRSHVPVDGPYLTAPGLTILDAGPFVDEADRFVTDTNYRGGLANNAFEGVYLDDFVIGFAERGELVTNANSVQPDESFVSNGSLTLTNPVELTQTTDKGPYQFEIRDGSEYVSSGTASSSSIEIQRFEASPVVIPIQGKPYGVANLSIPLSEIIPSSQRPPFQIYDLPTVNVQLDSASGLPITSVATGQFEVFLQNGTAVPLIPLDGGFTPIVTASSITASDTRFRTFGTNDRLSSGISIQTKAAADIVDGSSFTIFGDSGAVKFEYDITPFDAASDGVDDQNAIVIPIGQLDTNYEVAVKTIAAINQPSVQNQLGLVSANSNYSSSNLASDAFGNGKIVLFGDVAVTESGEPFISLETNEFRGDQNRDRTQQGVIIVENSGFIFNEANGVSIIRDAEYRGVSDSSNDEFPVALTYPTNLYELNTQGLIPGAVVQNNLVAFNNDAGIYVSGINGGGGSITTPVGYDQIVNNTLIGGTVVPGVSGDVQIYQGVAFDLGDIAFTDTVVLAESNLGDDVDSEFTNLQAALDGPDANGRGTEPVDGTTTVSLGTGGTLVLQFVDNLLTGNDNNVADLAVFETGASEAVLVEISRDGVTYFEVGLASASSPFIDIDSFGFSSKDRFAFVRLTDLDVPFDDPTVAFGPAGADIDAVGALSAVPVDIFAPASEGVVVENNAGPILLNNLVANFDLGINIADVDPDPNVVSNELSKARTVIGGSAYYRNVANANGTEESDLGVLNMVINDSQPMFVGPTNLLFGPLFNIPTVDSAIDSVEDRASLATVRQAIGINPVPVLAPPVDGSGQLRVDDPNVSSPIGQGENAFKDRGAFERTDVLGPRVTLVQPRALDLQQDAGQVVSAGRIFDAFEIQLIDGLVPADPSSGVGVDDASVNDGALIKLTKTFSDERLPQLLRENVDYRYAYDPARNIIRLTPIAGIWEDNAVYTIEMLGQETGIIRGQDGVTYGDGQVTNLIFVEGEGQQRTELRESVELDLGISVSVSPDALTRPSPVFIPGGQNGNIQGQSIEVFDGYAAESTLFVLTVTNDPAVNGVITDNGGVPVRVAEQATAEQVAEALAKSINESDVKLYAVAVGNRLQLRDSVVKSATLFSNNDLRLFGSMGYQSEDISFSPALRGQDILGESFTVFDGNSEVSFDFVTEASEATPGNTAVVINVDSDRDVILRAMENAINAAALQVQADGAAGILELRGETAVAQSAVRSAYARPSVRTGDVLDDAFKLSNTTVDVTLEDDAIAFIFGETITVFDGVSELTFEFEFPLFPGVAPGHIPVQVPFNATSRDIVLALKAAIDQSGLDVSMTSGAKGFRITGNVNAVSVNSETNAVSVENLGAIGTTPGFGLAIPEDQFELASSVDDGQSFRINRGPLSTVFELDFDAEQSVAGSTIIPIVDTSIDAVTNAVVNAINNASLALTAQNIGGGQLLISGDDLENVTVDVSDTAIRQIGIAGESTPSPLVVPLDGTPSEVAEGYFDAIARVLPEGIDALNVGERVLVENNTESYSFSLAGTSVITERVSDKVGNEAASADLAPMVIYMGGSFDWGDAPAPYTTLAADGGPRHLTDEGFALWIDDPNDLTDRSVTFESDARIPDQDDDNGVRVAGSLRPGFSVNIEVGIHNLDGRDFYLDAWFDWNANGIFENTEVYRYGSAGSGRSVLASNLTNVISVPVPADAALTDIYARFRLSEDDNLGAVGLADSGEVEDFRLIVDNNPFRNPVNRFDVNDSQAVTPLDALVVVNAIGRNDGNSIPLDDPALLAQLPPLPRYPDVSGDGLVSAVDALQVINELSRIISGQSGSGEGEWIAAASSEMNLAAGSSQLTLAGQLSTGVAEGSDIEPSESVQSDVESKISKTSVFDDAASMQLDSIVDSLAADNAAVRMQSDTEDVDDWFASL